MQRTNVLLGAALLLLAAVSPRVWGQESEGHWLTPTNFRAPEFPPPAPPVEVPEFQNPQRPSPVPEGELGARNPPAGRAARPAVGPPAGPTWINSPPLSMGRLRGKVMLIDFWEYTCINCIRTFEENKKWYERYHQYGFEIIGVHDPEFDIAFHVANVQTAVKRFGLRYPVVVDDGFQIWNSYHNSTWPSRFLVDARGVVRFHRDGEGGDGAFERAIQRLLQEAHHGLEFPSSYTIPADADAFAPSCGLPTPEMYVGDWSGRGILANPEGYRDGKTLNYQLPAEVRDGQAAVAGPWQTDKNGMTCRGKSKNRGPASDKLVMRYHARELYAVMNVSHGRPSRVYIQQDGQDLTDKNQGVDVQFDSEGHSYIEVREPRMYYLVANPSLGAHTVTLLPARAGLTVNSFTFGNDCQTRFPHL